MKVKMSYDTTYLCKSFLVYVVLGFAIILYTYY